MQYMQPIASVPSFVSVYNYTCLLSGIEKFDCEGRIITAEYERFYLLTSCKLPCADSTSVYVHTCIYYECHDLASLQMFPTLVKA